MNNKYFTQADIDALPDEWKLLPANGSKTPVDPITGRPLKKWTEADYTADDIKKMLSPHVKAVSVLTGERSGLVVIDIDAEEGKQTFFQIFGKPIEELPATLINTSGKPGSRKYYFYVSQEQAGGLVSAHRSKLDILWNGKQAVVLGKHPSTGSYQWLEAHSPSEISIAEAPEWLLEGLRKLSTGSQGVAKKKSGGDKPVSEEDELADLFCDPRSEDADEVALARQALRCIPAQKHEKYWDWLTVGMCLHAVGDSLGDDWIEWSSQMSNFNRRECLGKWLSFTDPAEYRKTKAKEPLGLKKLLSIAAKYGKLEDKSEKQLVEDLTVKGARIPALLEILKRKGLRFDELKRRIEMGGSIMVTDPKNYYVDLSSETGVELGKELVCDCLVKVAKENSFNPIEEYLERVLPLAATTEPIKDEELQAWFGFDSEDQTSTQLARIHLRACAMRGMKPGSKMDSVLIIAGPMGFRKSSAIKALAPNPSYYDEMTRMDLDNRDTLSAINSAFIFELSEVEKLIMSRESSVVKAWITRQVDNYVEKYESVTTEHPRRCCLFGTTNTMTFLNDQTGSRRFWIVSNVKECDVDDLIENRDRLWAHSLSEALAGEPYFLKQEDPLMQEANERGSDATVTDPWIDLLREELADTLTGLFLPTGAIFALIEGISLWQIMTDLYKKDSTVISNAMANRKPADSIRLSQVMQSLGWVSTKRRNRRGYIKL